MKRLVSLFICALLMLVSFNALAQVVGDPPTATVIIDWDIEEGITKPSNVTLSLLSYAQGPFNRQSLKDVPLPIDKDFIHVVLDKYSEGDKEYSDYQDAMMDLGAYTNIRDLDGVKEYLTSFHGVNENSFIVRVVQIPNTNISVEWKTDPASKRQENVYAVYYLSDDERQQLVPLADSTKLQFTNYNTPLQDNQFEKERLPYGVEDIREANPRSALKGLDKSQFLYVAKGDYRVGFTKIISDLPKVLADIEKEFAGKNTQDSFKKALAEAKNLTAGLDVDGLTPATIEEVEAIKAKLKAEAKKAREDSLATPQPSPVPVAPIETIAPTAIPVESVVPMPSIAPSVAPSVPTNTPLMHNNVPKTGDNAPIALYLIMAIFAMGLFVVASKAKGNR